MNNSDQPLTILLRAWVIIVGVIATCGWIFAATGAGFLTGPVALVILLALASCWRQSLWQAAGTEAKALVRWWPVAFMLALIAILAFAYQPGVHDTLTYRIPRIRLWMQDSGLPWYSGADIRVNSLGRNWEWLGMVILQLTKSERLLVLPSLISWVLLCRIFFTWARTFSESSRVAQASVLVLVTSPLFVVQGFTTMNDLTAVALVAISVMFLIPAWEGTDERRSGIDLVFSGLALALATGVKPNFGLLAVVWCAGALFWMIRKQGKLPWKLLIAIVPVAVIASGLPTLIMNYAYTGSVMAKMNTGELSAAPSNPVIGMLLGQLMFWWQSAQPVFNPLAGMINSATQGIDLSLTQFAPRFHLETELFKFGEGSTIGTFSTILIMVGVGLAVWRGRAVSRHRFVLLGLIAVGGFIGMSLNFATAIPLHLARSSAGFILPFVPLVLWGIGMMKGRWAMLPPVLAFGSVVICLIFITMEPNRSLLPARAKGALIEKVGGKKGKKIADSFRRYRERRFSGKKLYEMVPAGEESVGICLSKNAPTAAAWRYLPKGTKVVYYRIRILEELEKAPQRYFIVPSGSEEQIQAVLERTDLFEVVAKETYMLRLSSGDAPWHLIKRVEAAPRG